MENGAFAPKSNCSNLHNNYKYMILQRRQKAFIWSKRLNFTDCILKSYLWHSQVPSCDQAVWLSIVKKLQWVFLNML